MLKKDLSVRLSDFLEKTRNLMTIGEADRGQYIENLEAEYRSIYDQFSKLTKTRAEQLAQQETDEATQILLEHLVLGRESIQKVQSPIAKLIEEDPHRTDWAVSQFLTTLDAYKLIHTGKSKAEKAKAVELDERANRLLAGMLGLEGIELSGGFAKKVRGELLAQAVAYAHSHLCKKDVRQWNEDKELQKEYNGNVETYLCDCITRANTPLIYGIRHHQDAPAEVACVILEGQSAATIDQLNKEWEGNRDGLGGTAQRFHADAFCVNHDKKMFVVGGATTKQESDASQMESLVRLHVALEGLIENDPRYHGYSIRPFFFHSGYFCASEEGAVGQGRDFVRELREKEMPQHHIEALARMAFFNLLSEKNPSPTAGRVFSLTNPHVGGCNTLPQYQVSEKAREAKADSRVAALKSLKELALAAEAMASPAFDVSHSTVKGNLMQGLEQALHNFYVLFPLNPGQYPPQAERDELVQIAENLDIIREKLKKANTYGRLVAPYRNLARSFTRADLLKEDLEDSLENSQNKGRFVFSTSIQLELKRRWAGFPTSEQELHNTLIQHPMPFLGELYEENTNGANLIKEAIRYCRESEAVYTSEQMERMMSLAEHEILDMVSDASRGWRRSPNERNGGENGMLDNESFVQSFRNEAISIEKGQAGLTTVDSGLMRIMSALFQMDHQKMAGEGPRNKTVAYYKRAPAFLMTCLNSGDEKLMRAAQAVVAPPPTLTKRRGLGR